jgi:hypothetical protein
MDNPENPALQDTQDTIQRQTQHKHPNVKYLLVI